MPIIAPGSSHVGPNKKNPAAMPKPSRNSTPAPAPTPASSLPAQEFYDPEYLDTRVILFKRNLSYEDLVDQSAVNAMVPDSKSVDAMLEKLKNLVNVMEKRATFYDRGMRNLAEDRKKRTENLEISLDVEPEGKRTKVRRKRAADAQAEGMDQPPRIKDAKHKHTREGSAASSPSSPTTARSPSKKDVDKKAKEENKEETADVSSEDEGAPPKRQVPAAQTFGEDPSTFPDPTVYEIRPVHEGMPEEEKKEIYSVAVYPKNDLANLIAGDPPDSDYSVAKPSSQINFSTFSTYIDPYFRPFSEEDLGFLRERGDRVTPFVMPKRGKRHYSEIWAEEDGSMALDMPQQGREKLPPNQPRGSIDHMSDSIGETDALSIGPLASRLLQALRPEHRSQPSDDKPPGSGATNADTSMSGDLNTEEQNSDEKPSPMPPATYMTESSTEAWKKATHPKLEYMQVDERLKQELRFIGFLPQEDFEGEYDGHYDDEVAGRLRLLQSRLKEQMLINGARKARLTDLVRERMANQEYQTILEDLDAQVQVAYLKRTRTMGKTKKAKRPGGAGGGSHFVGGAAGTARPGIGDQTKTLMERRKRWIDTIGSVFDDESLNKVPRVTNPESSIFKAADMADLVKREKAQWDEEVEES
ncbi:hypothetical protein E4U14_006151 [Claviceps sp. LM454 group G7]|nr:hypothetical protein E4U14_006151 [Claviceps sp. LM454 group G7]